nr:MetaGeneMark_Unknown Function [uncultured bacterium]
MGFKTFFERAEELPQDRKPKKDGSETKV